MAKEKAIEVRATVAHTQPGTHAFRNAGDKFTHVGKLYEHVELVDAGSADEPESEELTPAGE